VRHAYALIKQFLKILKWTSRRVDFSPGLRVRSCCRQAGEAPCKAAGVILLILLPKKNASKQYELTVAGMQVQVSRKRIKNLYLRVCPPDASITVSAPLRVSDAEIIRFIAGKLGWIERRRRHIQQQPSSAPFQMQDGEMHFFGGNPYALSIVPCTAKSSVHLSDAGRLGLRVKPGSSAEERSRLLDSWYRQQLEALIPGLVETWQVRLSVRAQGWRVRKMKSRWGSCSPGSGHICLNLELAKKPVQCLEYIIIHELAHLRERGHGPRFASLLDKHCPDWKQRRKELARMPLLHGQDGIA